MTLLPPHDPHDLMTHMTLSAPQKDMFDKASGCSSGGSSFCRATETAQRRLCADYGDLEVVWACQETRDAFLALPFECVLFLLQSEHTKVLPLPTVLHVLSTEVRPLHTVLHILSTTVMPLLTVLHVLSVPMYSPSSLYCIYCLYQCTAPSHCTAWTVYTNVLPLLTVLHILSTKILPLLTVLHVLSVPMYCPSSSYCLYCMDCLYQGETSKPLSISLPVLPPPIIVLPVQVITENTACIAASAWLHHNMPTATKVQRQQQQADRSSLASAAAALLLPAATAAEGGQASATAAATATEGDRESSSSSSSSSSGREAADPLTASLNPKPLPPPSLTNSPAPPSATSSSSTSFTVAARPGGYPASATAFPATPSPATASPATASPATAPSATASHAAACDRPWAAQLAEQLSLQHCTPSFVANCLPQLPVWEHLVSGARLPCFLYYAMAGGTGRKLTGAKPSLKVCVGGGGQLCVLDVYVYVWGYACCACCA